MFPFLLTMVCVVCWFAGVCVFLFMCLFWGVFCCSFLFMYLYAGAVYVLWGVVGSCLPRYVCAGAGCVLLRLCIYKARNKKHVLLFWW